MQQDTGSAWSLLGILLRDIQFATDYDSQEKEKTEQVPGWATSHLPSTREDADRICWDFCQDSFHLI